MWPFDGKLLSGTVIDKHHYVATPSMVPHPVMAAKQVMITETAIPAAESWSLTVRGRTTRNKEITKEIYVDEMTYSTATIGGNWTTS